MTNATRPQTAAQRSLARLAIGAFNLTQPFETILLQAVPTTLFTALAMRQFDGRVWSLIFLSAFSISGAIGSFNDYCDYDLDSEAKPHKPLVRGLATPRFALWEGAILGIAGIACSAALNALSACFAALTLALGIWYDVKAKRSLYSWAPYALAIPTVPVWGFTAAGRFENVLLLAYPLGACLSIGLNVSNTLPDHDSDAAFGLRALTHRIKLWHAIVLAWGLLAAAMAGFAATAPWVGNDWRILGPGLIAGTVVLALMIANYLLFRSHASLKRNWMMAGLYAVIVGFSWVASLPHHK